MPPLASGSPAERFRTWYSYERDCNAKVLRMLNSVPRGARGAPQFTRAVGRMAHLVAARHVWLARLGVAGDRPSGWFPGTTLEQLPDAVAAVEQRWTTYLAGLTDPAVLADASLVSEDGRPYRWPLIDLLTQLFGHAWYHRGQIAMLVKDLGGESVDTDYIFWSPPTPSTGATREGPRGLRDESAQQPFNPAGRPMDTQALISRLERFPVALQAVVAAASPDDARFKPPSGAWSILEVVCHLADEETDDFRTRLAFVLDRKPGSWPSIDPEGWARDRRYNEQSLPAVLSRLTAERAASVLWLRTLPAGTDWSIAYQHPKFGPIRAGDLLGSWAAHDALHLRQIAKRFWELAGRDTAGFGTGYAGEWKA